jgi:predicted deacylase
MDKELGWYYSCFATLRTMRVGKVKKLMFAAAVLIVIAVGIWWLSRDAEVELVVEETIPEIVSPREEVIGRSVEGREIIARTYGTGTTSLLFVGGIHGGYEWNSVLLAYEFIDYLNTYPELVPEGMSVTIVPNINPDAVFQVVGKEGRFAIDDAIGVETSIQEAARFNANGVDLNRNFDCKWQPKSTWRSVEVSAGTEAFSEPEAQAIKSIVETLQPIGVVFWHSKSNAVYASECEDGILPDTLSLMKIYADAAGYPSVDSFDAYPITGDAEGWLASVGIPAITVELSTHETLEWQKNLAGFTAVLEKYRN